MEIIYLIDKLINVTSEEEVKTFSDKLAVVTGKKINVAYICRYSILYGRYKETLEDADKNQGYEYNLKNGESSNIVFDVRRFNDEVVILKYKSHSDMIQISNPNNKLLLEVKQKHFTISKNTVFKYVKNENGVTYVDLYKINGDKINTFYTIIEDEPVRMLKSNEVILHSLKREDDGNYALFDCERCIFITKFIYKDTFYDKSAMKLYAYDYVDNLKQ